MDRYAMNRCARQSQCPTSPQPKQQCTPAPCKEEDGSIYKGLDTLPLAMGYVPCQKKFKSTFDLCRVLQIGTIFPELCRPFCGQRRCCR